MKILGIETSCDETSASIVEDGKKILSLEVFSQIDIHKIYNGVVPEIASRNHLVKIDAIVISALEKANMRLSDIDAVAVTNRPGLVGALLVGLNYAKGISWSLDKPLIYINHIEAHIYSVFFDNEISFPVLALVVSGGHTLLYKLENIKDMILIGRTVDDAVGEAFDKVSKLLNLGYPGGPIIEKISLTGDKNHIKLPQPRFKGNERYFSYSGLKTALLNYIKSISESELKKHLNDIAASFQHSAFLQLLNNTSEVIEEEKIYNLIVCGGVAANNYLKEMFLNNEKLQQLNVKIFFPQKYLCGDNAAMVAGLAYHYREDFKKENVLYENAYSRVVKKGNP